MDRSNLDAYVLMAMFKLIMRALFALLYETSARGLLQSRELEKDYRDFLKKYDLGD